jgi:hypothetical protein
MTLLERLEEAEKKITELGRHVQILKEMIQRHSQVIGIKPEQPESDQGEPKKPDDALPCLEVVNGNLFIIVARRLPGHRGPPKFLSAVHSDPRRRKQSVTGGEWCFRRSGAVVLTKKEAREVLTYFLRGMVPTGFSMPEAEEWKAKKR